MTFIVLLLCLSVERFLHKGDLLPRFNWFECYVDKMHQLLRNQSWAQEAYVFLLLLVLPILLAVALIYGVSSVFIHQGLLAFFVSAFVLFYCMGPVNIYYTANVRQAIFWQANEALLAVVFWFAILGPVAAVAYRLLERTGQLQDNYAFVAKAAGQLRAMLDWLPVRLFSVLFALAGNFVNTSQFCLDHLPRELAFNREFIEKSGHIALGLAEGEELTPENNVQALGLIDRSLVIFLGIVFAITLGILL